MKQKLSGILEEMPFEDIQSYLSEAMELNWGYVQRNQALKAHIVTADNHGDYAPFGEYLYSMLFDYLSVESNRRCGDPAIDELEAEG